MWRLAFFSMMVKESGKENKRDVNITPVLEICTMIYNQRHNFHISGTIGWEREIWIFFDATLPHFSQPLKNILEKFLLISTIMIDLKQKINFWCQQPLSLSNIKLANSSKKIWQTRLRDLNCFPSPSVSL